MNRKLKYYKSVYRRFGYRAIWFLISSKFAKNKLGPRKIYGIKHLIYLSNYGPDVTTLFQIFFAKEYEVPFYIAPGFIIDCGANIGLSAVYYANTFPEARIIAIEPDKNNFDLLKKNTALYKNVFCLNKAVWSHAVKMEMIDIGFGNWSLQTKVASSDNNNTIEGISISEIMEKFDEDKIDVLKIDIEGAEKELFSRHYEEWLPKAKIIAIELHDNLDCEISAVFYKALEGRVYKTHFKGENLICEFI